jgi:hypothetical protein
MKSLLLLLRCWLLQVQGVLDGRTALHHAAFAGHCGAAAAMLEAVWSGCVAQRHTDTKHLPRAQVNKQTTL